MCILALGAIDRHVESLVVEEGLAFTPQLDALLLHYLVDGHLFLDTLGGVVIVGRAVFLHEGVQHLKAICGR